MISFMADILPIHTIWMTESLRRNGGMTAVALVATVSSPLTLSSSILTLQRTNTVHRILSNQRNRSHSFSLLLPPPLSLSP